MAKKLLSIRDENTILITIRFIIDYVIEAGVSPVQYDFDLIVKNNITVDKLLEAVRYGLIQAGKIDETIMNEIENMDFLLRSERHDSLKRVERDFENTVKMIEDSYNASEETIYRECLAMFLKCYKSYLENTNDDFHLHPKPPEQEFEKKEHESEDSDKSKMIVYEYVVDDLWEKREELFQRYFITADCIDKNQWRRLTEDEKNQLDHIESVSDAAQFQLGKRKLEGKTLKEIGFVTSTRIVFSRHEAGIQADKKDVNLFLFEEAEGQENKIKMKEGYKKSIPLYNISNRPLYQLDTEPIKIIPPTEAPKEGRGNGFRNLISPILMAIIMMISRSSSGNAADNKFLQYMYLAVGGITIVTSIWNIIDQRKTFKKSLSDWKSHYEKYIQRIIKDIVKKQTCDVKQLKNLYPSMLGLEITDEKIKNSTSLVDKCREINPDIFTRGKEHPDFLTIRIGLSASGSQLVSSIFSIVGEKKDYVFTSERYSNLGNKDTEPFTILLEDKEGTFYEDVKSRKKSKKGKSKQDGKGYLIDLPAAIAEKYAYLKEAPVLLKLWECETLGIVLPKNLSFYPILDNIIMNLSFYHSPDDVQIVFFCKNDADLSYITGRNHEKVIDEAEGKKEGNDKIDDKEKTDDTLKKKEKVGNQWNYRQNFIDKYRHLPHFRELLGDLSAFVFDETAAGMVFNRLYEVLLDRTSREDEERGPHIVLIFQEEYSFKRHAISEFLSDYSEQKEGSQRNNHRLSFIFCKNYEEELPKYCGQVIVAEKKFGASNEAESGKYEEYNWYLYPHIQMISRTDTGEIPSVKDKEKYSFTTDMWNLAVNNLDTKWKRLELYQAYKTLSAIYYYRIAQGVGVPSYVELFDLMELYSEQSQEKFEISAEENTEEKLKEKVKKFIEQQWNLCEQSKEGEESLFQKRRDVTETLAVPIGKKSDNELIFLDLHEKADGPHMLVAGTTGSGKTETILTYLIGLCMLYTPEQVNLLLMDMKGAGFVKRIGDLPHVVGKVTDIDGDETGTGMLYMLKRFLHSMSAEVKRRKRLLNKMDVDSVDGYINAKNNLKEHIKNAKNLKIDLNTEEGRAKLKDLEKLPQLPHLFVVIDEFTELMRFTGENSEVDFKAEITSLARIGRSLGFHIILISQNIENAITSDIRVNSKARLCLKVATREASKEMIGSDRAADAHMPGNGRAYLLVGTGSRFEYFQSGYASASIIRNLEQPYQVTWAKMNGAYTMFFDSEENEKAKKKRLGQDAQSEVEEKNKVTQISLVCEQIEACYKKRNIEKPTIVFQSILPSACYYEFDWNTRTGTCKKLKKVVDEEKKDEEK